MKNSARDSSSGNTRACVSVCVCVCVGALTNASVGEKLDEQERERQNVLPAWGQG